MNVEERVRSAIESIAVEPGDVGSVILEGRRRRRRNRSISGLVSAAGAVVVIAVLSTLIAAPSLDRGARPIVGPSDGPSGLETPRHDASATTAVETVPVNQRGAPVSLAGTTTSGTVLDVADRRGKVVVVWLWGTWCKPCREMLPTINTLATRADIQVVGAVFDEPSREGLQAEEDLLGVRFDSVVNPDEDMLTGLTEGRDPVAPSIVLLDRQGRVAATAHGDIEARALDAVITSVTEEPEVPSSPVPTLLVVRNATPDPIWISFRNGNKASLKPGKELRLGSPKACSLMPLRALTMDGDVLGTYDRECAGQTWTVGTQPQTG